MDGFEEKGSYRQHIHYSASLEIMEAMINRSTSCVQKLGYDCKRSRLLNTPVGDSDDFSPYGYWVSVGVFIPFLVTGGGSSNAPSITRR